MKERPILFSAPMIPALLAGTKTQTRRVIKWQSEYGGAIRFNLKFGCITYAQKNPYTGAHVKRGGIGCPYGAPGDRLWVRETHYRNNSKRVRYRADDMIRMEDGGFSPAVVNEPKWRPSIHMPRWASRITLEVTAVRVERLKAISDWDCQFEGVAAGPLQDDEPAGKFVGTRHHLSAARLRYECLWESINGPGSWDANPWVWVIEFNRIKP